jgi:cation/acetate symporter
VYGYQLEKVSAREKVLNDASTPAGAKEAEVRAILKSRADAATEKLKNPEAAFAADRAALEQKVEEMTAANAPSDEIDKAKDALAKYPKDVDSAVGAWTKEKGLAARANPIKPHAEPFAGKDEATRDKARLNFLTLVFCLMVGTAALPHILMRYYTTPSVKEARKSVFYSLFFIFLLYFTAPALAVLVKYDVYHNLVGSSFAALPSWVAAWAKVDPTLMSIADLNGDGLVQLAEIVIGGDLIVLATPEIAGLPYVISGMVAAGGLAAALSTADGLLLTIANALSHDVYYKVIDPNASTARRLAIAKGLLLIVALIAAYVTSLKPGNILFLVGAAFSLAAAAFFPALVCGVFWRRANKTGAVLGMLAGLGVTMYYMIMTYPFFGINAPQWFGINPISSGIFGIPIGFAGVIIGSLLTAEPSREVQELVSNVRYPNLDGQGAPAVAPGGAAKPV